MVTGQHGQGGLSVALIVEGGILQGVGYVTTLPHSMVGKIVVLITIHLLNKDLVTGKDVTSINQGTLIIAHIIVAKDFLINIFFVLFI